MRNQSNKIRVKQKVNASYKKPQYSLIYGSKIFRKTNTQQMMHSTGNGFNSCTKQYEEVKQVKQCERQSKIQASTCSNWYSSYSTEPKNILNLGFESRAHEERRHEYFSKRKKVEHRKFLGKNSPYIKDQKQYQRLLNSLKPVKGPTESVIQQIKRHNDNNRKNAENVLLASRESFKEKINKFSSRIGLRNNEKIFIMNSKDSHIREALQRNGWVEVLDLSTSFYHLKWVYNDTPNDYTNLREGQYFNHFKNNQQLTNKNLLRKNISNAQTHLQPNFPVTFDLQCRQDQMKFQTEYIKYQIYNALIKLHNFITNNFKLYYEKLLKINCLGLASAQCKQHIFHIPKIREKHFISSFQCKIFQQQENKQMKELRQLLYKFCFRILEYISSPMKKRRQTKKLVLNIGTNSDIFQLAKEINSIFQSDEFGQYIQISEILQKVLKYDRFLLLYILLIYKYLQSRFKNNFGIENWWIIKPAGVSRGSGIKIQKEFTKIIANRYGKIAQKYIQKPLLLDCGRKFDIRQWVLVKSFVPLEAYIFEKCYCRFSASKYSSQNYEVLTVHLTNYSKQKELFQKTGNFSDSIMSQQNLQQEIDKISNNGKWKFIKKQIKTQILKTLKCCKYEIESKSGCFEVYGFDILLDSEFKPWILQVNMSPACQKRVQFLNEYLSNMAEGIIDMLEERQIRFWEKFQEEELKEIPTLKTIHFKSQKQIKVNKLTPQNAATVIQKFFRKVKIRQKRSTLSPSAQQPISIYNQCEDDTYL